MKENLLVLLIDNNNSNNDNTNDTNTEKETEKSNEETKFKVTETSLKDWIIKNRCNKGLYDCTSKVNDEITVKASLTTLGCMYFSQDTRTDIEECKKIIGTVYDSLPKTIKHNS